MTEEENENSTSDCHEETGIFCPKVMKLELNYFFSIFFKFSFLLKISLDTLMLIV